MKKKLKKFLSAFLATTMLVSSVVVSLPTTVQAASAVTISESAGWFESAYVEWAPIEGAKMYEVYVKEAGATTYAQLDDELIRKYPEYWRADALGLKAGNYVMKVVATLSDETKVEKETSVLAVQPYDRSGFAFSNGCKYASSGIGAYNNDGTLKSGASVLYVTEENKNDVKLTIGGKEYTGVAAITQAIKVKNKCQPVAIRIIGQVSISGLVCADMTSAYAIGVKEAENVTFEGVGEDATLYECGVASFKSNSIEVRNLGLMNWGGGSDGDGITLKESIGVWVHNNDVFYGNAGKDGDQAKGDGSMDLKDNSQYVAIAYNHFWDSGKMSLCGMKSESGPNYITYHHNWFDHSDSRHPRVRTMSVHVYNNYFDGNAKYGIGAAKASDIFAESNYFRNCCYPMMSSKMGSDVGSGDSGTGTFSGEDSGIIKAYNNYVVGAYKLIYANTNNGTEKANATSFDAVEVASRTEKVPSTYVGVQGGHTYNNFDTTVDLGVAESTITPVMDVPSVVMNNAGRMNGGDFKWTFDNVVDDTSSKLNVALKEKVNTYTTSLVSVGGSTTSTAVTKYDIAVTNGTASPTKAAAGATVSITAQSISGKKFKEWTTTTAGVTFANAASATTTFVMPESSVSVTATYEDSSTNPGSDPGTTPSAGAQIHDFTADGMTSSFYTISGNLSDSKGSVTYNGKTLTQCLKMESSTKISFTAASDGVLTLVFGGSTAAAGKRAKVNGTNYTADDNGIVTAEIKAGSVEVTKTDSINLFYMVFEGDSTGSNPVGPENPGNDPVTKAGFVLDDDGAWRFYENGQIASGYTGLAYSDNVGWWYVENGVINFAFNGLVEHNGAWWCVAGGQVAFGYTGLWSDQNVGWWYVENGMINFAYNGLILYNDAWWCIASGRVAFEYTGLWSDPVVGWWYIENGMINFAYNGLIFYSDAWWCVAGGRVAFEYTGLWYDQNVGWWYVENGMINFTYTGETVFDNTTYFVENGCLVGPVYYESFTFPKY